MNQNFMDRIIQLMKKKMRDRRWRLTVSCLSAVLVFAVTYALVLPGITMTDGHPSLQAEELAAVSGEELTVRVTAKVDDSETEKTVILIADGEGADLSASYDFNEEGICVITDEAGKEIELHRSARENSRKKQVIDYWFTLSAGEETSFTLDLIDEVDENRFAKLVEAVQESAQENAAAAETGTPGTASASDAAKAAPAAKAVPAAAKAAHAAAATSSNASRASASNADIAEANAAAKDPEERIVTEENNNGFVEILDGKVINDLADADSSDEEDEERVKANLRLSAGIGNNYAASVKDAERNADKRGDAELKFTWTEKQEEHELVKPELTVSVGDAKIAVICGDETVLPADAWISAYEIGFGTPEYEALAAQAAGAVAENAGGNEKSVTRARFFDITIYDGAGNEIQPEGDVKVIITYEKQNASENDGEMNVVHFGEDGPQVVDLDEAETADDRDSMEFTASSFSIYGIVYTVDFEYELNGTVFTYQLEGGESISLKALIVKLGVLDADKAEAFVDTQVDNVRFSDESLVKVTRVDGDWKLESIAPFITEEVLTVSLKDGRQVTVKVTDSQESTDLRNFVSNVWFVGVDQDEGGKYHVEAGKEYSISILFEETTSCQFDNRSELTYQIPEGITILSEQSGDSKINVSYRGENWPVAYSYTIGTDGKLTVKFKENDPNFHLLEKATNVSFSISYHGEFEENIHVIEFAEDLERTIVFDEPKPNNAYVEKTATFDETTGKFNYTILVTADGDVTNVNVKDVITGNALTFNNDVQVSGNTSDYTDNGAVNGFDYTFASMREGETITITYSASVNFAMDTDNDGRITVDQTKNTVTVKPDPGEPHTSEYSREINYKTTSKSNGVEVGTEGGDKIIEWTIDYNPLALAAVGGDTITDRIGAASADYMKYYGDGITVEVYDHNGTQVGTRQIAYADLTSHSDSSWTYKIPETDTTPYSYKITYQTIVDMEKVETTGKTVSLDNTANDAHGGINVTPEGNLIGVRKDVESHTTAEVDWVATLDIPESGLAQAVVTDTLPKVYLYTLEKTAYDLYKDGTLRITELIDGEEVDVDGKYYTVDFSTNTVKITFYYYVNGEKVPGLEGKPGGRQIKVRLTTTVDQEWLQEGYKLGGYYLQHTNKIDLNGVSDTATVIYGETGIEKNGQSLGNGSFLYSVLLSGVSEVPVTVVDNFDTSLLKVDTYMVTDPQHMHIFGGTQYSQIGNGMPVRYTDTSDGIILTADSLPMQTDGQYYPYYRIDYYLKLKDGVDLEALAMANGGEHELTNHAEWNGHETSFTYVTKYDYLDKKLLNEGQLSPTNRTAEYQITFNSKKALLHKGEPMTMTDTLSKNLSVDYSSIQIVTDPEGAEVPYSLSGGEGGTTVATYTVPDATKVVITYKALVVGNGEQTIVNKVKVNGRDKTVEAKKDYGSASEGQAGAAYFKIVKVDKYDANKKLPGVEFKVYADDPDLDFGKDEHDRPYGKELTLTTNEKGEIYLDGGIYQLFFNKVYHIREIKPPADYGINNVDYTVTLTNKMSEVNYEDYVYYFTGDSMQIKNTPLEGLVVEKQVESDEQDDKTREYQFKISILNDNGSVNTDYNEKNGDDQFVNGEFTFKLKDGQQKMFWGFSKGTKYKVEELDADGFAVSVTYNTFDEEGNITGTVTKPGESHTGDFTQENEVIIFKNKKTRNGDLTVSKILVSDAAADADQKFTFTVTLGDTSINGTYGGMTFTDGVATVELKGGESATASGLPAGISYTVTEAEAEGFVQTGKTGEEGTISSTPAKATFSNARKGSLQITKKVTRNGKPLPDGETDTFADGTYYFIIKKGNEPISYGKVEGETITDGTVSIVISNGSAATVTVTDLPAGTYTVKEDQSRNPEGVNLTGSQDPKRVIVENGKTTELTPVEFVNNKIVGSITVHKDVKVNGSPSSDLDGQKIKVGLFTEEPADTAQPVDSVEMGITDGSGEVTFEGLEPGTYYVYELDAQNHPVKNGGTISLNGKVYTVEEDGSSATITDDEPDKEIRIVNKREFGSLKVRKTVTYNGQEEIAAQKADKLAGTYTFTLYTDAERTKPYLKDGKEVKVELKILDDCQPVQSEEIGGLPAGTYYLWEEVPQGSEAVPDVNPVPVIVEAGKTGDAAVIADFRNNYTDARDETYLTIKKTFVGIPKEKIPADFTITVRSTDGEVVKTLDKNTEGLSISGDGLVWSWKLKDLPGDKTYTISEVKVVGGESVNTADVPGYTLVAEGFDVAKTVTAPTITYTVPLIETTCSHTNWPVGAHGDDHFLFAASLTDHGTLIVTKEHLSEGQRKWVEETLRPALASEDSNVWKAPVIYYSTDEHPNGFTIPGKNHGHAPRHVSYNKDKQEIDLEDKSLWQHVAKVSYQYIPDYAEFETKNTYTPKTTEISGTKKWIDGTWEHADPELILLRKTADGTFSEVQGKTPVWDPATGQNRTYKFTGLEKYDDEGREYTYAVKEVVPEGYAVSYSGDGYALAGGTITNTEVTEISRLKSWAGSTSWPVGTKVTMTLSASAGGTVIRQIKDAAGNAVDTDVVLDADHPRAEWTRLPKYDENKNPIEYVVTETKVTVGDTEFTGDALTARWIITDKDGVITNTPVKTGVKVEKLWEGDEESERPDQITYTLAAADADGSAVDLAEYGISEAETTKTGEKTSDPAYSAAWENLPKYTSAGKEIIYTVSEGDVAGYVLVKTEKAQDADGIWTWTFTNKKFSTQFEAQKRMKGRDLREGDVYSFQLFQGTDEEPIQTKRNDGSGKVTFDPVIFTADDFPAIASDSNAEKEEKTITYRIKEAIPQDADNNNVKGGIKYDASEYIVSVTLSYDYTTREYAVSDPAYTKDGAAAPYGAEFINEELRDFEFSKVWKNSDKVITWPERVASITVTLRRTAQGTGGSQSAVFTVTKDGITENAGSDFTAAAVKLEEDGYRYKVTDLEKYNSDGTEWTYSISETTVEGFNKPAYFIIDADGQEKQKMYSEETSFVEPGPTGGVKIVNDETVFILPSTGGPGTVLYTLGGAALLTVFALMYGFRVRCRK